MAFRLRPQAIADILAIATYIQADNPRAATTLVDEFYNRFQSLGDMPGMGKIRPELSALARSFSVGNYIILYHVEKHGVEIIRVVDGRSSAEGWL